MANYTDRGGELLLRRRLMASRSRNFNRVILRFNQSRYSILSFQQDPSYLHRIRVDGRALQKPYTFSIPYEPGYTTLEYEVTKSFNPGVLSQYSEMDIQSMRLCGFDTIDILKVFNGNLSNLIINQREVKSFKVAQMNNMRVNGEFSLDLPNIEVFSFVQMHNWGSSNIVLGEKLISAGGLNGIRNGMLQDKSHVGSLTFKRLPEIYEGCFDRSTIGSLTILNSDTVPNVIKVEAHGSGSIFFQCSVPPIYVPAHMVEVYKNHEYWSKYAAKIVAISD